MALSLGSGRRRWSCRAARRGGNGWAGCRHFHVHYHFPRQVYAFSSLPRLPFSLLLSYLLVPPVLFFAVLAFLVCFGWFTLVHFVSSLLGKCNSHECLESNSDANDLGRNEELARNRVERAGNSVAEGTGVSALAEPCIGGQKIKEVFVDGFGDEPLDMSRISSPYDCMKGAHDCTKDEEHSSCEKLVEEVMVFETNCKEFISEISCLDVSSEIGQLQDMRVDRVVEEMASRGFCTSCGTANLLNPQSGLEFFVNRMEAPVCATSEILELIHKHETGAAVVICSDNSEENYVNRDADFSHYIVAEKAPEDIFDEHQRIQNTVIGHTNKLSEDHFIEEKGKQIIGISDKTHDLNNESKMSGLPLGSVSEKEYSTVATSHASSDHTDSGKEDAHVKELTEDNMAEASGTTTLVCDFDENNLAISKEIASGEISVIGRTDVGDKNSFTSEEGLRRLPLVRRSKPPWWNLCGVLDVFTGCKD